MSSFDMALEAVVGNEHDCKEEVEQMLRTQTSFNFDLLRKCLWRACRNGKIETAKVLIEYGADVHYSNHYEMTLLIITAYEGTICDDVRVKIVELLVQNGANPDIRDNDNKIALFYAVQYNYPKTAVFLAQLHDLDTISDAFLVAVENDNIKTARKMLLCGADVNYFSFNGVRALIIATCRGFSNMVSFLLNYGAHIDVKVGTMATALHFAARKSKKESDVLTILLERGANVKAVTKDGNTPLHYAVDDDCFNNVVLLLKHGSDVNHCNRRGETPLSLACRNMNKEIVELLLQHGADANTVDEDNVYPLNHIVVHPSFENFEIVDLLLQHGARINQNNGAHVLALLCSNKPGVSSKLVVELITRGANYNLSGWFGYINHGPTIFKIGVWAASRKAAAVAYFLTFVYGEEKGLRPVPVPRRLTGAYGLYPIRRRLASYLIEKSTVRDMVDKLVTHFKTERPISFSF